VEKKVLELLSRLSEVEEELGSPELMQNRARYLQLTQEHKHLTELNDAWVSLLKAKKDLEGNQFIAKTEQDPEFGALLEEEGASLKEKIEKLEKDIETLIVPPNPDDHRNIIMELRAGTGGDEAAIFVGDCVRMYLNYAAKKGWSVENLSSTPSEMGGYKEYQFVVSGENVHRFMQYEAGIHRVQRVPKTEAQGRLHTSAITVAVLMEPGEEEEVHIDEKDLKIDTYRSSGAGGQHVNTTDSAVRMTHIPTGIIVHCQDERSQIKNRAKALRILSAKIIEKEREEKALAMASVRSEQVGTGDRSGRIRTYNYPQNRVTDHRINLTLHKLDYIMEGDLDELTSSLVAHFYKKNFETA
jgi:peptide chain release factor 1